MIYFLGITTTKLSLIGIETRELEHQRDGLTLSLIVCNSATNFSARMKSGKVPICLTCLPAQKVDQSEYQNLLVCVVIVRQTQVPLSKDTRYGSNDNG